MTNYPSDIIERSRFTTALIESIDNLPVNNLSASGVYEPNQNGSATENFGPIIAIEQFKMTEHTAARFYRNLLSHDCFFVGIQSLIENISVQRPSRKDKKSAYIFRHIYIIKIFILTGNAIRYNTFYSHAFVQ